MSKSSFTAVVVMPAFLVFSLTAGVWGQVLPAHEGTRILKSGRLVIEVGDPASDLCLWNQGMRFSPVANVLRAQLAGREFLYSPIDGGQVGGRLGGLPMEFDIGQEEFQPDPPGYNEGASGSPFLKVGVGILRRNAGTYNFMTNYPVIELAETTVDWHSDRAHFVQTLSGTANGFSCRLAEDLIVKNNRLILKYRLENTGWRTFTTEQYIHNFLSFSGTGVGPNYRIKFPYTFTASPEVPLWSPPGGGRMLMAASAPDVVRIANMIVYLVRVSGVPKIWVYKPGDYLGPDLFLIEQTDTAQRLIIDASVPSEYIGIWTTNYQVSPEQFVLITLAPGEQAEFTRSYTFYADGVIAADCTADGVVDARDLSQMSSAWLSAPEDANWEPSCDISEEPDDLIDLVDLATMAEQWETDVQQPVPDAHWRLDETSGETAIDDAGGHHGTLHNFAAGDSHWVTGRAEGGLRFDGIDDFVEVEGYTGVAGKHARTVMAWVKTSRNIVSRQTILAWGQQSPGRYWLLEVDSSRRLNLSCDTGLTMASGTLVGDKDWHHVAAVLRPFDLDEPHVSDIELYVDGQRQGIYKLAESVIDTGDAANVRIGASHHPQSEFHFDGTIDDVRIYPSALSYANIRSIYAQAGW